MALWMVSLFYAEQLILQNFSSTIRRSSTGIFTLRMTCSAMRTSQATLQRDGAKRGVRTLASLCVAHVANTVIQAADAHGKFAGTLQGKIRQRVSRGHRLMSVAGEGHLRSRLAHLMAKEAWVEQRPLVVEAFLVP